MRAILAAVLLAAGIGLLGTFEAWLPGAGMSSIVSVAQAATVRHGKRTPGLDVTDCVYHQNSGEMTCKVVITSAKRTPGLQVTDCQYHPNSGEITCKVEVTPPKQITPPKP